METPTDGISTPVIEDLGLTAPNVSEAQRLECFCVTFARTLQPKTPRADAKDIKPNGPPQVGGLVLLQYGMTSHVAYIEYLMPGGAWVKESNFVKPCVESERFISWNDKKIVGFWRPQLP